ncbi:type II toxin-antitoxin system RelE/ParE family toxin [Pseudomonas helleri]|jgi:putative addiction module killer protein|uniref:Type II toxin-antitoxin system RelE/ParE family toxin n=1 Tax=Pseudomonas helleri TaxID=1608996 RepID=A0A6A7ZH86_9PSED|nr:type II toxin-antitoxin system RelE/ParE family toxin [Pseudomonas helleri]MQT36523.1 type II toxin-antitoxin system RelE/ParE family toxin [Pseudomonas helleri]MQU21513.1 type II toxin-antitoxin system RelE/ParE family toxin [Pseudomonas helleri]MQU45842.1 type II toxin-antitoxin system RelE/ParE family toxin [Pseudomonas helleri]MQU59880.1 type II toxin-antitoxin system RelE/ParE family toxin [Pseudomonas helleri]
MITFEKTHEFAQWLSSLKDKIGQARILARLRAAELGHFSDCEPVGDRIYEMRIHCGPGYRVYYTRKGKVIYLLLIGGDKTTQARDIKRAKQMVHTLGSED